MAVDQATEPQALSVSPSSGSGATQTFTVVVRDFDGVADLNLAQLLVKDDLNVANACYVIYSHSSRAFNLAKDASGWLGAVSIDSTQSLSNSQCTVSASGFTADASGDKLTVTIPISFKPAFSGAKNLWVQASDSGGASGWKDRGDWTP